MNNIDRQPVKIAHVVGKMVGGGVEAVVMNYYRNIDRSLVQYDFIVDEDSTLIPEEIEKLGGRVITVPPYEKQFRYQRALYRIFRENKYRMVYSHLNTLSVFPLFAAWRAGVPLRVAHNHSTAGKGELKRNIMKYTLRPFSRIFPNRLCACSEYAGKWMFGVRTWESGRVIIWKNAVEVDKFCFDRMKREKTRDELDLGDKLVIGHVGRFMHQKNHEFIVDIFKEVHDRKPDSMLLLTGSGELMEHIRAKVRSLGLESDVVFTGNRNDVENIYQAMDVFVMPSFFEGLGMVVVEAQIAGLPVVCADTVPVEARICDRLKYLSLDDSAKIWADHVLMEAGRDRNTDMRKAARDAGYDIADAAGRLQEWYACELELNR